MQHAPSLVASDVPAKGRVLVGFRERDARFVMDMQTCHTLARPIAEALPGLSQLLGELDCRSRIPQLETSCGDEEAALIVRHLDPLSEADRASELYEPGVSCPICHGQSDAERAAGMREREKQMELAEEGMGAYRNALRKLAT